MTFIHVRFCNAFSFSLPASSALSASTAPMAYVVVMHILRNIHHFDNKNAHTTNELRSEREFQQETMFPKWNCKFCLNAFTLVSSSETSTTMLTFSQNKQLILLHFKSGNGNGHTTYFMDAFNSAALIFYFICSNSRRRRQRFSLNSLLWPRSQTRAAVIIFVHFSSNYHTYCFQHMLRMGY